MLAIAELGITHFILKVKGVCFVLTCFLLALLQTNIALVIVAYIFTIDALPFRLILNPHKQVFTF